MKMIQVTGTAYRCLERDGAIGLALILAVLECVVALFRVRLCIALVASDRVLPTTEGLDPNLARVSGHI